MKVEFTHKFIKIFKKRFSHKSNVHARFDQRLLEFVSNPNDPKLSDHSLKGRLGGYRSFSITGDIRVVYYVHNNTAYFVDIGTHNQVYNQ